jgi:intracellular septation protein A
VQWQLMFLSMFPILAFAAVENVGGQRKAVYAAVLVAAVECLYNSHQLGFIEAFSLTSLASFAVLGWLALRRNQIVVFKFQPVAMSLVWAGAFWIYDGFSGDRLLPLILEEYVGVNELISPHQRGYFARYAATMSTSLPFLLVFHAGLTAYAAVTLSTWWWFQIRVVGFYLLVVALFYYERVFQMTY